MSSTLTVWYNTKCPVCNAGIERQHRRLVRADRAGVIEFRGLLSHGFYLSMARGALTS